MYTIYESYLYDKLAGWVITDPDGEAFWFEREINNHAYELDYLNKKHSHTPEAIDLPLYIRSYPEEDLIEVARFSTPKQAIDYLFMDKLLES